MLLLYVELPSVFLFHVEEQIFLEWFKNQYLMQTSHNSLTFSSAYVFAHSNSSQWDSFAISWAYQDPVLEHWTHFSLFLEFPSWRYFYILFLHFY